MSAMNAINANECLNCWLQLISQRLVNWKFTYLFIKATIMNILCENKFHHDHLYIHSSVAVRKLLLNYLRPNSTKQRVFIWWFIQHFSSKDLELDELWNFEKYWKLLVIVGENIDHPATRHSSAIVRPTVWVFWIAMPSITEKIIRMFWFWVIMPLREGMIMCSTA